MSFFKLKDGIDRFIFRGFNLASDAVFFANFSLRALLKKNRAYEEKHAGQRCFILGTGPSLASLSPACVESLQGEAVFAVNSIYKASVVASVSPTYYVLADNNYWGVSSGAFKEIADRYSKAPPTFITDKRAKKFVPDGVDAMFFHAKNYPVDRMRFDLSGNLSISMNVVGVSLLAAIYMGFKEIYLLGCDYNLFCSRVGNHCYDDKDEAGELPVYNLSFFLKYYHLTTEFHYAISRLAKSKGVKIVNLTPGSLLDAYPMQAVDTVLHSGQN